MDLVLSRVVDLHGDVSVERGRIALAVQAVPVRLVGTQAGAERRERDVAGAVERSVAVHVKRDADLAGLAGQREVDGAGGRGSAVGHEAGAGHGGGLVARVEPGLRGAPVSPGVRACRHARIRLLGKEPVGDQIGAVRGVVGVVAGVGFARRGASGARRRHGEVGRDAGGRVRRAQVVGAHPAAISAVAGEGDLVLRALGRDGPEGEAAGAVLGLAGAEVVEEQSPLLLRASCVLDGDDLRVAAGVVVRQHWLHLEAHHAGLGCHYGGGADVGALGRVAGGAVGSAQLHGAAVRLPRRHGSAVRVDVEHHGLALVDVEVRRALEGNPARDGVRAEVDGVRRSRGSRERCGGHRKGPGARGQAAEESGHVAMHRYFPQIGGTPRCRTDHDDSFHGSLTRDSSEWMPRPTPPCPS